MRKLTPINFPSCLFIEHKSLLCIRTETWKWRKRLKAGWIFPFLNRQMPSLSGCVNDFNCHLRKTSLLPSLNNVSIPNFPYFSISGDLGSTQKTLGCNYRIIMLSPWIIVYPTGGIPSRSLWLFFSNEVPSLIKRNQSEDLSTLGLPAPTAGRLWEPLSHSQFKRQGRDFEICVWFLFDTARLCSFSGWLALYVALSSRDIYDAYSSSRHSSAFVARGFFCLQSR